VGGGDEQRADDGGQTASERNGLAFQVDTTIALFEAPVAVQLPEIATAPARRKLALLGLKATSRVGSSNVLRNRQTSVTRINTN
jgi:hypothetical protein